LGGRLFVAGLLAAGLVACKASGEPREAALLDGVKTPPKARPTGTSSAIRLLDARCAPRPRAPSPGPTPPELGSGPVKEDCGKDDDCNVAAYGRCLHRAASEVTTFGTRHQIPAHNDCLYDECTSDDECRRHSTYEPRAESVCDCSPERRVCGFANCRTNADCPPPFTCGPGRYCGSTRDACRGSAECKASEACVYSWKAKHYVCETPSNLPPE
jgi:hypothetical protein